MNSTIGYTEIFTDCGDEEKIALVPTTEEIEAAYASGRECEGATRLCRGTLQEFDFTPAEISHEGMADLLYRSRAFTPAADGLWYFCDPFHRDGRLVDLIATGGGSDDNGESRDATGIGSFFWSTGIADALGKENLAKTYTADTPLLAYFDGVEQWREDDWRGVAILKNNAKALLRQAAFVRLNHWDHVADFAEEFFPDRKGAVSGPDDAAVYAGCLERQAVAEIQRTKPRPMWLANPWGWLEAVRIARGGDPNAPLPPELRVEP